MSRGPGAQALKLLVDVTGAVTQQPLHPPSSRSARACSSWVVTNTGFDSVSANTGVSGDKTIVHFLRKRDVLAYQGAAL